MRDGLLRRSFFCFVSLDWEDLNCERNLIFLLAFGCPVIQYDVPATLHQGNTQILPRSTESYVSMLGINHMDITEITDIAEETSCRTSILKDTGSICTR